MSRRIAPPDSKLKIRHGIDGSSSNTRRAFKTGLFLLLCLTARAQGSDLVFAEALVTEQPPEQLIQGLSQERFSAAGQQERDLNPYGLYLSLNRQESLEDNGSRQSLGLEWELFEDGWFEKKRRLTQQERQNAIGQLQRERDLNIHNEQARDAYLNQVTSTIKHHYAEKLLELLGPLFTKRKQQMENGFATLTDVSDVELKQRKAQLQLQQTRKAQPVKLSADYARIGNTISGTALKPSKAICGSVETLPSVSVHDAFADLTDNAHSYWDDVDLSVFMEYRDIQRQDTQLSDEDAILEGYVAGINLRLPFFTAKAAQKQSKVRSSYHRYNKIDTIKSLANSCREAIRVFRFSQEQLLVLEAEHDNLLLRRNAAQRKAQADLPGNEENYEREVELLDYLILLKEENILVGRIQTLANLMKIRRYHPSGEVSALIASP